MPKLTFTTPLAHVIQRQHIGDIFLFFPENLIWHFKHIVSINLYEMSNPVFGKE